MSDSGIKIEVHLIQNFAPSNLNRDDAGQPKSAYFGGVRRARVSSQCGKHAARDWWREHGTVSVGHRTKKLQQLIGDRLADDEEFKKKIPDEEDRKAGIRVFTSGYYAAADTKKPDNTSVLVFISPNEVDVCTQIIKEVWDDRIQETTKRGKQSTETIKGIASIVKEVRDFEARHAGKREGAVGGKGDIGQVESGRTGEDEAAEGAGAEQLTKGPKLSPLKEMEDRIKSARVSADIALFGRMLAEQPGRNTDGACQIAHPISTHKVDMEMDFYTAVEELNLAEETGAGMMGVVGFNSACYYRYALVDRDQLARNLASKTEREKSGRWTHPLAEEDFVAADMVIKAFLEAMVYAIPTGKQNSFAAQNLPSFGLFIRRKGGVPISLANAFCIPVRPKEDDEDLIGLSVAALTDHWETLKKVYGIQTETTACFHIGQAARLNGLSGSEKESVNAAINCVMTGAEAGEAR